MNRKHAKAPWEIVPWKPMEEIVDSLANGSEKHGKIGWKKLAKREVRDRYFAKVMRHLTAWRNGQIIDESGQSHLAHAVADILILMDRCNK